MINWWQIHVKWKQSTEMNSGIKMENVLPLWPCSPLSLLMKWSVWLGQPNWLDGEVATRLVQKNKMSLSFVVSRKWFSNEIADENLQTQTFSGTFFWHFSLGDIKRWNFTGKYNIQEFYLLHFGHISMYYLQRRWFESSDFLLTWLCSCVLSADWLCSDDSSFTSLAQVTFSGLTGTFGLAPPTGVDTAGVWLADVWLMSKLESPCMSWSRPWSG